MSNHSKTTSGIHNGANSLENNQSSNENKRKRISERVSALKESDKNTKKVKGDNNLLLTDNSKNQILVSDVHSDDGDANNTLLIEEGYHSDTSEVSLYSETESQEDQSESSDTTNTTHDFRFPGQTEEYNFKPRRFIRKLGNPMGPFVEKDIKKLLNFKQMEPDDRNQFDSMWVRLMMLTKVEGPNKCWVLRETDKKERKRLGVLIDGVSQRVKKAGKTKVVYVKYRRVAYTYLFGIRGLEDKEICGKRCYAKSCVEGCFSPFHSVVERRGPEPGLVSDQFKAGIVIHDRHIKEIEKEQSKEQLQIPKKKYNLRKR